MLMVKHLSKMETTQNFVRGDTVQRRGDEGSIFKQKDENMLRKG